MHYRTPFAKPVFRTLRSLRPGLLVRLGVGIAVAMLPASSLAQGSLGPSASSSSSASGGVLGQIGRELSGILLQNRTGVVMIRGHRFLTIPAPVSAGGPKQPPIGALSLSEMPSVLPVIGSGFLVQNNVVVTTAEVAENIQRPSVILSDGKRLRVTAVSVDVLRNLAILIVEGTDSGYTLHLGNSDDVLPGMLAVTIGTQAGFSNSGGLAFIAQTGRPARSGERRYNNLIQFQGAIGPGCSGSPLLNPTGEVIGIVMAAPDTAGNPHGGWSGMRRDNPDNGKNHPQGGHGQDKTDKSRLDKSFSNAGLRGQEGRMASEMPGSPAGAGFPGFPRSAGAPGDGGGNGFNPFGGLSNIGFALPINELRNQLPELIRTAQKLPGPVWTGVQVGDGTRPGAYVTNLYEGSPAALAGLEIGDVITQIDAHAIHSRFEFIGWLLQGKEGQTIKVQVWRAGASRQLDIRLRAFPSPEELKRMNWRQQNEVGLRVIVHFSRVA